MKTLKIYQSPFGTNTLWLQQTDGNYAPVSYELLIDSGVRVFSRAERNELHTQDKNDYTPRALIGLLCENGRTLWGSLGDTPESSQEAIQELVERDMSSVTVQEALDAYKQAREVHWNGQDEATIWAAMYNMRGEW